MARAHVRAIGRTDVGGDVVIGALATFYEVGTNTLVTDLYNASSGGSASSTRISNTQGEVEGWLATPRQIDVVWTDNSGTAYAAGNPTVKLATFSVRETLDAPPDPSELARIVTVATLAARDALTPDSNVRVFVTATNRTYYYDGSKYIGPEELFGILNLVDFGLTTSSTAVQNLAAWNAMRTRMDAYPNQAFTVLAPAGRFYFSDTLLCDGATPHDVTLNGVRSYSNSFGTIFAWSSDLGAGKYAFAKNLSSPTPGRGTVVNGVNFEGPNTTPTSVANTSTTANVTFPANNTTTFTLSVATTTGYDTPGTASVFGTRGCPGTTAMIVVGGVQVYYTGKTSNSFTGCHVEDNFGVTKNSGTAVSQDQRYGGYPSQMMGVRWTDRMHLKFVQISGFSAGLSLEGDHNSLESVETTQNGIGLYVPGIAGMPSGDQILTDCQFDADWFAAVAVGNAAGVLGQLLAGVTYRKCHFLAPFAFYHFPGASTVGPIVTATWDMCSFESIGNALVYDEDTDTVFMQTTFLNCPQPIYASATRAWGYPADASIIVPHLNGLKVVGSNPVVKRSGCALRATLRAVDVEIGDSQNLYTGAYLTAETPTVPYLLTPFTRDIRAVSARGGEIRRIDAGSAVLPNDLVQEGADGDHVQRYTSGRVIGVAQANADPATTNMTLLFYRRGPVTINATGTINTGDLIKPDAGNAGKCIAASSWTDGPIIGHAITAASAGVVLAELRGVS